jgi:hypothetical protein
VFYYMRKKRKNLEKFEKNSSQYKEFKGLTGLDVISPLSFAHSGAIRYSIRVELFVQCVPFGVVEQLVTHLERIEQDRVG